MFGSGVFFEGGGGGGGGNRTEMWPAGEHMSTENRMWAHVQSNDITEEIPHFRYMINSKSDTITQPDTDTARAEADTILVRLNPVTTDIPNKPLSNGTIYWNSKENTQEVCIC